MPLRTASLEEPQLNLTPMIDIVFLLIIFFMVGTRFTEIEQQFNVELPTAATLPPVTREPDPLVVSVSRTGEFAVNGDVLTLTQLKTLLTDAQKAYADQAILIRGDGDGQYQAVIDVMDLCHQTNIRKLSLAFQPVDPEATP
jgi:biopolymer transport protein ExbD